MRAGPLWRYFGAYMELLLNSNRFNPSRYANCELPPSDSIQKPCLGDDVDIVAEQSKDPDLMEIKYGLENDKLSHAMQKKHIVMDNILYYTSQVDSDPVLRLYIPKQLRHAVTEQYHDDYGHMGLDVLDEILKLIESVSEDFPSYS